VREVHTQQELIESTVKTVTHGVRSGFPFFLGYLELPTGETFLMLGKLIQKFQGLDSDPEDLMMRKSEQRVGLLL